MSPGSSWSSAWTSPAANASPAAPAPCRCTTCSRKSSPRQATARDLAKLEELCDMVKNTSLCGLGQTAPNPVLSTLRFFRHEYEELLQTDPHGPRPTANDTAARNRNRRNGPLNSNNHGCQDPHHRRQTRQRRGKRDRAAGRRGSRRQNPHALPPRRAFTTSAPAACASSKSLAPPSSCRPAPRGSARAWRSRPTASACRNTAA